MNRSAQLRGVAIALVAAVALGGCPGPGKNVAPDENRGEFGKNACAKAERTDVPANAAIAFYYDNRGNLLDKQEDMFGTEKNRMCPSPGVDPDQPGTCRKAGYCVVNINGTEYCVKPCP